MTVRYTGKNKRVLRSLKPQGKDAPLQLIGEVDKVLPSGGVVCSFVLTFAGEDGNPDTKKVGLLLHASNLRRVLPNESPVRQVRDNEETKKPEVEITHRVSFAAKGKVAA
jgi:hypothetical protein